MTSLVDADDELIKAEVVVYWLVLSWVMRSSCAVGVESRSGESDDGLTLGVDEKFDEVDEGISFEVDGRMEDNFVAIMLGFDKTLEEENEAKAVGKDGEFDEDNEAPLLGVDVMVKEGATGEVSRYDAKWNAGDESVTFGVEDM